VSTLLPSARSSGDRAADF